MKWLVPLAVAVVAPVLLLGPRCRGAGGAPKDAERYVQLRSFRVLEAAKEE
jgi:hypothetical protein